MEVALQADKETRNTSFRSQMVKRSEVNKGLLARSLLFTILATTVPDYTAVSPLSKEM
jgi:hypothetical protein